MKNLDGMRFGRLLVTGYAGIAAVGRQAIWHCSCDCGGVSVVKGHQLRSGKTHSCGCLKKQRLTESHEARRCQARADAITAGSVRYIGSVCGKCGSSERLTASRSCVKCKSVEIKRRRSKNHERYRSMETAARRRWRQKNAGRNAASAADRRAMKIKATPAWADRKAILAFYSACPPGHHVDHIVPLKGRNVCGLHVLENLQYLPAVDNMRKSNHFLGIV